MLQTHSICQHEMFVRTVYNSNDSLEQQLAAGRGLGIVPQGYWGRLQVSLGHTRRQGVGGLSSARQNKADEGG